MATSALVSRLRQRVAAHSLVLRHAAASVAGSQRADAAFLNDALPNVLSTPAALVANAHQHQRISPKDRDRQPVSKTSLQPAYPIVIGDRAQARAGRFFIGRLRSRIIRRFVLRGMVLAPLVGSFFAAKAAYNETLRARATRAHADGKIPALFAAAAACDTVNCATLTGAFIKAAHHHVPLPPLMDYNIVFWWADYLALPSSLSLTLAASGATFAVAAEVLFEQHAANVQPVVPMRTVGAASR